jgi:radical SAM superfamily enzyme YgiQ (UPF0313 family)
MPDPAVLKILTSEPTTELVRNTERPVMLIGFQQQGNLGLGYLASTLRRYGYKVEVFDFEQEPGRILERARAVKPVLIGFSLIFQFYIRRFGSLVRFLRDHGINCHFTMGGHFPSLSYQHTLAEVPELDSVVRFEGELTLLELVDHLALGRDWRGVHGLAYERDGEIVTTPLRRLMEDLDQLPYPERDFEPERILGCKAMPLLASRGCARTCSFCSIHTFYRSAPGKVVRTRKPVRVVEEMRMLYEERGINIFLFQDDDFPLFGPVWQRWVHEFVDQLYAHQLPGHVIWKMNCRADVVEPKLFTELRRAGCYLVYMGLESGSEEGLETLHKQITVKQNLHAVEVLKSIGMMFEFGFMLFDPSSTFQSIRENVDFLRAIVGDGSASATFCRMLPYDGTPIKDELERTGRLRGDVCNPDYEFLDPRMSDLYEELREIVEVTGWIHGHRALTPQLNWAWNEVAILERLFPLLPDMAEYRHTLSGITKASNDLLFRVVEDLASNYSDGKPHGWSAEELRGHSQMALEALLQARNGFVERHQVVLLEALHGHGAARQQAGQQLAISA